MVHHDNQPSLQSPWRPALKVLIYWEFQRISHTSLVRLGIWELRVEPLRSLQKGLNEGQRVLTTVKMTTGSQEALLSPGLPGAWGGSQKPLCSHRPQGSVRRPTEQLRHNLVLIKELTEYMELQKLKKTKRKANNDRNKELGAKRKIR